MNGYYVVQNALNKRVMKDIYGEKKKPNCKYGMLSCVAMICGSVNATSQLDHENENAFIWNQNGGHIKLGITLKTPFPLNKS